MIVECHRCGAPLEVTGGARHVRCSYCDSVNRVRSMRTLNMQTPPNWRPPPTWTPPPQVKQPSRPLAYHQPRRARSPAVALVALFGAVMLVGVGVTVFVSTSGGSLGNSLDPDGDPVLGAWNPSQGPRMFQGSLSLGLNVPVVTDFACPHGSVQSDPTVHVTLPSMHLLRLRASTINHPVVIVRNAETGQYSCDHQGTGPAQVSVGLPAGTHAVWVGDVFSDPVQVTLDVSAEPIEVMPSPTGLAVGSSPSVAAIDLDAQREALSTPVSITGEVEGRRTDFSCRGWFPARPHLSLHTSVERSVTLTTAGSVDDLTLMLRQADGRYSCDDDSGGGGMAQIATRLTAGTHELWVGTFERGLTSTGAVQMSAPVTAEVLPSGIAPSAVPIAGELNVDRRGASIESVTMPEVDAHNVGGDCRGYIPMRPHVVLRSTRQRSVTLTTTATSDLTMVVLTASGAFRCDDDSGRSQQPRIRLELEPGDHQVWVGAYSQTDAQVPFELRVR